VTALQGSQMKVVGRLESSGTNVHLGLLQSISPSITNEAAEEKGIGGYTRTRMTKYDQAISLGGLVTSKDVLAFGTNTGEGVPPAVELRVHDATLGSCYFGNMTISGGEDAPLEYSLDGMFLSITTGATAPSAITPETYFVFSDATITWGSETDVIRSFSLGKNQDVTGIYGTSMSPTDVEIGTATYEGEFVIASSTVSKIASGAWDPAQSAITFEIEFVDASSASHTITFSGTGAKITGASGSVDPDSEFEVTQTFSFETFTIA